MKKSLCLLSLAMFVFIGCADMDSTNMYRAKAKTAMDRLCVNDGTVYSYEVYRTVGYKVTCKNGKTYELSNGAIDETYGDDVIAKLNEITKR
jgi:hypothetical protein